METRRNFIKWLYRAFIGLWGIGIIGVVLSYLKAPKSFGQESANWIKAGRVSGMRVGSGILVSHAPKPFWVIKLAEQQIIAISAICTHMQCIVKWEENRKMLVCPCHQGEFNTDGNVLSGIPSKPLAEYKVEIRGDEVYVII